MRNKKPPFEITNAMIDHVAEIAELVGRLTSTNQLSANPTLRRTNRIRTIHGSLAIEQNTLTLEQVTAVLNGKQVLAPPKDIAEVKNAYEIYERLDELDPYSVDDLMTAHGIMTRGLVDESGMFRTRPVGVVDQEGHVLHFGTLPQYVPNLVMELLDWVKSSDVHMLIRSCVFHYEFELIHPFADGNGRVGRLWHTLLLSKWNPAFAWLPVESMIHARQPEYYAAINASNDAGESTVFIEFMLSAIKASLIDAINTSDEMSDGPMDKATMRWKQIEKFLETHEFIMNADVRTLCNVSAATANRIMVELVSAGKFTGKRKNKFTVIMPDYENEDIMAEFDRRYNYTSGKTRALIEDAIVDYSALGAKVYLFNKSLQATYYVMDNVALMAFFKHSPGKATVPYIRAESTGSFYDYIVSEKTAILDASVSVSVTTDANGNTTIKKEK